MKKIFPVLVSLALLVLLVQTIFQLLIKESEATYSIATNDNSYIIDEKFNLIDGKHYYSFKITDKTENIYYFHYSKDLNKQDRIIKNIKYFDYDDIKCIFPIYTKNNYGDLYCYYKDKQVSYTYLKQQKNESLNEIITKLNKENYKYKLWNDYSTKVEEIGKYKFYSENFPSDTVFAIWFYKGIYVIRNGKVAMKDYLEKDHYENNLSTMVDNFYISVDTDTSNIRNYSAFYVYDLVNGGKERFDFNQIISTNSYLNGGYNKLLYYTDLDAKIQYSFNPDNGDIKEVGNIKEGFKVATQTNLITVPANDFLSTRYIFDNDIKVTKLIDSYGAIEIRKDYRNYYYFDKTGDVYKVTLDDLDKPTLLFNLEGITEMVEKDNSILIVAKDMVYYYDENSGLVPIVQSKEFNYNHKNIANFAKK